MQTLAEIMAMQENAERHITVDLIRRANRAAIMGKRYADHIEEAASKLPRLTAVEINRAWARANGKASESV